MRKSIFIGAVLGLIIGILYGALAGFLNCRYGGCSVTTSLIFLGIISLYWVASGGLLGAIVGIDQAERRLSA